MKICIKDLTDDRCSGFQPEFFGITQALNHISRLLLSQGQSTTIYVHNQAVLKAVKSKVTKEEFRCDIVGNQEITS